MKLSRKILTFLLGALMIIGGYGHFANPDMYSPFIPKFLPEDMVNYGAGVVEIILGLGTFIPAYRKLAFFGILILMLIFLPLHIIDVFAENPAIGSHQTAYIRLPLQFVLILWAWLMWKQN
jgi:uncharacterized membrane protein